MKKVLAFLVISLAIIMPCFSQAASEAVAAEKQEITVFAAASMTETMTEIGNKYMEANPNVSIVFNFDSSGTLKRQIEEGAECDIFISAAPKQMNQLIELNLIDKSASVDLLQNKVTLCLSEGTKNPVSSFEELADALKSGTILFAMGNSDVPVGQYTAKIFKYFSLDEEKLASSGVITYCSNVKEVTTQIKESSVDAGTIYKTDAFSAGLKPVAEASDEMCGGRVIYPAAITKMGEGDEAVSAFFDYILSDDAKSVFESVGFSPLF